MLNRNKAQKCLSTAYFDEISEIELKNVEVDFEVDQLFSEYQMPPKKTKNKPAQSQKNRTSQNKISESSISTKERSKNEEESCNNQKHPENMKKQKTSNSLKKNVSKKVLFIGTHQQQTQVQNTIKKTAKKETIYSELKKVEQNQKKLIKSPQAHKMERKLSKLKAVQDKSKFRQDDKKALNGMKEQNPMKISRQSSQSNKKLNPIKKSRSSSIILSSTQRLPTKNYIEPKIEKLKQDNKKIIMRDYFGQDEEQSNKKKTHKNTLDNLTKKRSTSKPNKDFQVSRQRVESKSKELTKIKSRERIQSKSKEKIMVLSSKNRFSQK